ncbi:MAG: hypothetical protein ABIO69_01310 [Sphingomicrobium sp.]
MKRFATLALSLLAACATAPAPVLAGPTAGLGELAHSGDVWVRPLAVLEDSRCPATVQCVWAGQVRIRAEITSQRARTTRDMTLGKPVLVSGGSITLADVQPGKLAPGTTDPRAYRFTFETVTLPRP